MAVGIETAKVKHVRVDWTQEEVDSLVSFARQGKVAGRKPLARAWIKETGSSRTEQSVVDRLHVLEAQKQVASLKRKTQRRTEWTEAMDDYAIRRHLDGATWESVSRELKARFGISKSVSQIEQRAKDVLAAQTNHRELFLENHPNLMTIEDAVATYNMQETVLREPIRKGRIPVVDYCGVAYLDIAVMDAFDEAREPSKRSGMNRLVNWDRFNQMLDDMTHYEGTRRQPNA